MQNFTDEKTECDTITDSELLKSTKILYFSDGILEEFSENEDDAPNIITDDSSMNINIEVTTAHPLVKCIKYDFLQVGKYFLNGVEYIGEVRLSTQLIEPLSSIPEQQIMEIQTLYPHSATLFAAICACVFTAVGIFGNLITVLALINSPKIRCHATTAFVLSLCISDLLFCSVSLPLTAVRFFKERWTFGDTLCKIFPVLFYGNVAVSLLSMVCITVNRYILIACHSLYACIYKRKFIVMQLIFVWAVSFLLLLPAILGIWGEMGLDEITFSCTILKKDGKSIKKTLFLIGFLLPCLVIIISYTCIYIKVLRQKKRMISHRQYAVSTKEHALNAKKSREDNKLTQMMVTIFVCFLFCFLPLMLANVVDDERNTSFPWLHIVSSVMAWASSVINPIIYAASNKNYRLAYFKVFSVLKFWGEPMSPMQSKSFQPSRNSKDFSATVRSTPLFHATKINNIQGCETYSI